MKNFRLPVAHALKILIVVLCLQSGYASAAQAKKPHFKAADLQVTLDKLNLSDAQVEAIETLLEQEVIRKAAVKTKAEHLTKILGAINLTTQDRENIIKQMASMMSTEQNIWFKNMMDLLMLLEPEQAELFLSDIPAFNEQVQFLRNQGILKLK